MRAPPVLLPRRSIRLTDPKVPHEGLPVYRRTFRPGENSSAIRLGDRRDARLVLRYRNFSRGAGRQLENAGPPRRLMPQILGPGFGEKQLRRRPSPKRAMCRHALVQPRSTDEGSRAGLRRARGGMRVGQVRLGSDLLLRPRQLRMRHPTVASQPRREQCDRPRLPTELRKMSSDASRIRAPAGGFRRFPAWPARGIRVELLR